MTMDSSMCLDLPFQYIAKIGWRCIPCDILQCCTRLVDRCRSEAHTKKRGKPRKRPTVDEDESKVGTVGYSFTVGKLETLVAAELGPNL